jgi:uncharacterized membrane protein
MNGSAIILFRLIHILSGAFWVGAVVFVARFLMPSLRAIGPAGGPLMQQLTQVRRLPVYIMGATLLTILSGLTLYWHDSLGFKGPWLHSGSGRVFGLGGAFAIIAAIVGMAITSPTAKRLGEITGAVAKGGGPPSPEQAAELGKLQGKMYTTTQIVAGLVLLATAAMAIARYVG